MKPKIKIGIFEYKNFSIDYLIKDNFSKNTLLFIHGYNSSIEIADFCKNLKNNFNIVSFSLPGSKIKNKIKNQSIKLDLENLIEITLFIAKKINKNTNLYIFGHSIGGLITSFIAQKTNVEKIFYIDPVHPYIINSLPYILLKNIIINKLNKKNNEKNKKISLILKKLNISSKIFNTIFDNKFFYSVENFINPNAPWYEITKNILINHEFITKILDKNFQETKNISKYISGNKDTFISTKEFIKYVENKLNSKVNIIGLGHVPFNRKKKEFNELLNKNIKFKKRGLWSSDNVDLCNLFE